MLKCFAIIQRLRINISDNAFSLVVLRAKAKLHPQIDQRLRIDILAEFGESTRLKVNFDKLFMVPINVTEERLDTLASTLNCSKGSLLLLTLAFGSRLLASGLQM